MPKGLDEGNCRSCKNPIYWIRTPKGKAMPLDKVKMTIVDSLGETHTGYESHFSTCPNAGSHRKKP